MFSSLILRCFHTSSENKYPLPCFHLSTPPFPVIGFVTEGFNLFPCHTFVLLFSCNLHHILPTVLCHLTLESAPRPSLLEGCWSH